MEKVICALWKRDGETREQFNQRLLETLPDQLASLGARSIRINVEDAITDAGAALRQSRGVAAHHATLHYWLPSANALFRGSIDAAISKVCARWAGWLVVESTMIANTDHPPERGARNWGWAQLAFLTLPETLDHATWLSIWQDDHSRVAIETQANFEYVQNLVVRALTPDAPPYVAIVEECFPEAALTDPFVFFDAVGDQAKFQANLDRMMTSCDRFITRGTIDVIPTSQYNF